MSFVFYFLEFFKIYIDFFKKINYNIINQIKLFLVVTNK